MPISNVHSRKRLAAISHHFLSDAPVSHAGDKPLTNGQPVVIPILNVRVERPVPFTLLTRALLARGRSASVLDVSREVQDASHPNPSSPAHPDLPPHVGDVVASRGGPASAAEIAEQVAALAPPPSLCLVPMAATEWPLSCEFGRVMMLVGTRREAVIRAYHTIKRMQAAGMRGSVGVVMVDATNMDEAAHYFDTLAEACELFLERPLVSYGYLPLPPARHAPVDLLDSEAADGGLGAAVGGIATLLVSDLGEVRCDVASKRSVDLEQS